MMQKLINVHIDANYYKTHYSTNVAVVQMVAVVRALMVWASAVNPNVHQWLRQVESV